MRRAIGRVGGGRPTLVVEAVAGVALFVFLALFSVLAKPQNLLFFMPDDVGYFLKIAENVVAGRGLSFDGIDSTTGFQPLWLAVLVPLSSLASGLGQETMLRLVLLLQLLLLAAAAVLLRRVNHARFSPKTTLLSGLLFYALVVMLAANGMESALLVLLLSALLYAACRGQIGNGAGAGRHLGFGILLGFVMLARVDMVFLGATAVAAVLLSGIGHGLGWRRAAGMAFAVLAGATVMVLPYLAFNVVTSGHAVPISGMVKSSFPVPYHWTHVSEKFDRRTLVFAVVACGLAGYHLGRLGWAVIRKRANRLSTFDVAVAALAGAVVLHAVYTLLFSNSAFCYWQFIAYALVPAVGLNPLVDRGLRDTRIPGWVRNGIYGLAVGCLFLYLGQRVWLRATADFRDPPQWGWHAASYEAAVWVRQHLPSDAVLAIEHAGIFGYFSARPVVNLDGVANNFEFQDAVRERRLRDYMRQKGVQFVARHGFARRPDITKGVYDSFEHPVIGRLSGARSDELRFSRNEEIYRSAPYQDDDGITVFVIWKIPAEPASQSGR